MYSSSAAKRKRLIVVGNKPPGKPGLAEEIDAFDYVVRVNRMNYLGAAGNSIDGLFLEANLQFKYKYHGGTHRQRIKEAGKIFMRTMWYERFTDWYQYLAPAQYNNIEIIDESFAVKETGFQRCTSSILLIAYLLNSIWSENYQIYITCLDVENRAETMNNDNIWSWHMGAGKIEQEYLLKQIKLSNLIRLDDE
jgi:hypothetical protein